MSGAGSRPCTLAWKFQAVPQEDEKALAQMEAAMYRVDASKAEAVVARLWHASNLSLLQQGERM